MIALVIASFLATQPLVATGNDLGVWFVRDNAPGATGPSHELCYQIEKDKYQVVLPLAKRPIALAVQEQTLWFVGASDPPILYRARLVKNKTTGAFSTVPHGRANAVKPISVPGTIKDLVFLDDDPILVVEHEGVQCYNIDGSARTSKLQGDGIHISVQGSSLIATTRSGNTTTLHTFNGEVWELIGNFEVDGNIQTLMVHDGWPILITTNDNEIEIIGLQQDEVVKIAAFQILSGRWAIISGGGLHAIGVERNGTTTAFNIGWPSGRTSDPIELGEQHGSVKMVELLVMIVTTGIFIMMMISILRRKSKLSQNNKKN